MDFVSTDRREMWERIREASAFRGEVGRRCDWDLRVVGHRTMPGWYGITHLWKFVDEMLSLFVWFTVVQIEPPWWLGQAIRVRATVRRHVEYDGVRQTVLYKVREVTP